MLLNVNNRMVKGNQPSTFACGTIIHGLCEVENTNAALGLLRKMEERNFIVVYSALTDCLLQS